MKPIEGKDQVTFSKAPNELNWGLTLRGYRGDENVLKSKQIGSEDHVTFSAAFYELNWGLIVRSYGWEEIVFKIKPIGVWTK